MKNWISIIILLLGVALSSQAQNRRATTSKTQNTPSTPVSTKSSRPSTKSYKPNKPAPVLNKPTAKIAPNNVEETTPSAVSTTTFSKFSTTIELDNAPSDAAVTLLNIFGQLALNFHLSPKVYTGVFFSQKLVSTNNYETIVVDSKPVEMPSFNQYGGGLLFGFNLTPNSIVQISPELRAGFNNYTIQGSNFNTNNNSFINHKYIGITPRLNLGFKLSDYSTLGVMGGYTLPLYIKGAKNDAYNPQAPIFGVFFKFSLPN